MTTSLSANFAQVSATKLNADVNWNCDISPQKQMHVWNKTAQGDVNNAIYQAQ